MKGSYQKTSELLPVIEKHLRGGKTLKEISYLLDVSVGSIWKIAQRNPYIQAIINETHDLRVIDPRYQHDKIPAK